MTDSLEITGRAASPGLAAGPIFRLDQIDPLAATQPDQPTDPGREGTLLAQAVEAATSGLTDLMDRVDEESAAIVEFQIAMLEDDSLAEPAIDAIAGGATAVEAWSQALDAQIADYRSSDDDYFQARSADLADLKDRVLRHLSGERAAQIPPGSIVVGSDITPTRFLETDWTQGGGLALLAGSAASHVAMLARSRGVPMAVGLGDAALDGHGEAILDGGRGSLILSPDQVQSQDFAERRVDLARQQERDASFLGKPATTADGTAAKVMINVADLSDLDAVDAPTCDGIGLMRSEFLFYGEGGLPDEETQYQAYKRLLRWAADRPVIVRTLDAGGDKPIPGLTPEGDKNPFLGVRGVRLSLARPDIFTVQLRALARAAEHGQLKIMLPMVTVAEELDQAAQLLDQAIEALKAEGIPCARPPLGIMVEVPAVALEPDLLSRADFFSIGSNDLTQYVMAGARDNPDVSGLLDAGHAAVTGLIDRVALAGNRLGIEVSLCGDMAGDPAHTETLLKAGIRTYSVAPPLLGRVKATIADIDLSG
ncbi:MAG: phosphoenolpyruvate--protein phosphotransferase [Pseudomonadota bacterium]